MSFLWLKVTSHLNQYYLDALVTDKEEVHVSRMSDFCVDHKSRRHIAILIGHLVLGVREEASVVTLLYNQECDLWVVSGVQSLDSPVNGSQLHAENLIKMESYWMHFHS